VWRKVSFGWIKHTNKNFIETTKKFFTFDVSTSIRGLRQKKLVLDLLPVLWLPRVVISEGQTPDEANET